MMEIKQAIDLSAKDIAHKVSLTIHDGKALLTDTLIGVNAQAERVDMRRMIDTAPHYCPGETTITLTLLYAGEVIVSGNQEVEVGS